MEIECHINTQQQNLLVQRAVLRQKLNALRSPIYRLSVEIMAAIFLRALPSPMSFEFDMPSNRRHFFPPDLGDLFFPITLNAVSAHWRDVASSTPLLWSLFQFPAFLWSLERPPYYTIDIYLQNSKDIPLQIDLAFPFEVNKETRDHFFHSRFDRLLAANLSRIRTIMLKNPPLRWLHQLEKLSSATSISIQWDRSLAVDNMENLRFNRCRSLSRLALRNAIASDGSLRQGRILVPCSLTILDLTAIHIDTCIKVALRCPDLVEMYTRYSLRADEDLDSELAELWFGDGVTFNRLEVLFFGPVVGPWESTFLGKLHTPVLQSFTISNQLGGLAIRTAEDGFGQFVKRLPPTFSTLEIEDCEFIEVDSCDYFFNHQTSVRKLKFVDSDIDSIINLLQTLQLSEEPICMPHLEVLHVMGCIKEIDEPRAYQWMSELEPTTLNHFVRMLERRLVEGSTFRLEFSRIGVDWTPVLQARLRALVRRGVQLQVVEGGDQVDWL